MRLHGHRSLAVLTFGALGGLAACGSSNNPGTADAAKGLDASPDAIAIAPGTVFAVPLSTPSGDDQGSFYGPTMTAGGKGFVMDLDTGSSVTAIAGATCTQCGSLSPLYTPSASAVDLHLTDDGSYDDGTGWHGEIYDDVVSLGGGVPGVGLNLVDITSQTTNPPFFDGNEYQGILGMGTAALLDPGTTDYLDQIVAAGVTDEMAFELCPASGTMWLGGFDQSHATGAVQYTPILTTGDNAGYFELDMTAIALGSTDLGATSTTLDGPVVDTGTSLTYIPSDAETALIAALNASSAFQALFPSQTLTDPTNSNSPTAGCVNAAGGTTDAMVDAMLPPMKMTFAASAPFTLSIPATVSYFYDYGGGQFCLGVYGGGDMGQATLGDAFMRAFVTVIDVKHDQIGFAPTATCAAAFTGKSTFGRREHGRGPHRPHPTLRR